MLYWIRAVPCDSDETEHIIWQADPNCAHDNPPTRVRGLLQIRSKIGEIRANSRAVVCLLARR